MRRVRVGIVAPGSRLEPSTAQRVTELAAERHPEVELYVHPQCQMSWGHFAGSDAARIASFLEIANDASFEDISVSKDDALHIDGELFAMNECFAQLSPFSTAARARIFSYLYARLGPPLPDKGD